MYKMSKAELSTMEVLWDSDRALSIKDIPEINNKLNNNTVAAAIKKLLNNNMIEVADVIYHGRVLARQFKPIISKEEYYMSYLDEEGAPTFNLVCSYIKNRCNATELEKLKKIIDEHK